MNWLQRKWKAAEDSAIIEALRNIPPRPVAVVMMFIFPLFGMSLIWKYFPGAPWWWYIIAAIVGELVFLFVLRDSTHKKVCGPFFRAIFRWF